MAKKYNHLHRYKKIKYGRKGQKIYKCILPGCQHFIREELILNAICTCWYCDKPTIITKDKLDLVHPRCDDCKKKAPIEKGVEEFLNDLGLG